MSTLQDKILRAVFNAIDEVNQLLPKDQRLKKSEDVVLSGVAGELDSLGLITFIVATEQKIEEEIGQSISLTDERAMSQTNTPLRSVETLVEYISLLLKSDNE